MDVMALIVAVIVSIAVGVVGARLMLEAVLFLMMRPVLRKEPASIPTLEARQEEGSILIARV
jgi:hypothetical protein